MCHLLKIWYGSFENDINGKWFLRTPSMFFDNQYIEEWLEKKRSKDIIKDVDDSSYILNGIVDSPVLGKIPITEISGGAKTLILLDNCEEDFIVNVTGCGDNCSKWLLEIAKDKDIEVGLDYLMKFDFSNEDIIKVMNTENIHKDSKSLFEESSRIVFAPERFLK